MFEDDGVPGHQVRRGEAGDLVVRVVPRHDSQQRADGRLAYPGLAARLRGKGGIRQQSRSFVRVIAIDVDHKRDLPERFCGRLAHLPRDQRPQALGALFIEVGDATQHQ